MTEELAIIPHSFGEWSFGTVPTKTEAGTAIRTCECGETDEVSVPALTDTSVWTVVTEDATHFAKGSETYSSVYGVVTVDIPMIVHTFGDWTMTEKPTETETGYTYLCLRCRGNDRGPCSDGRLRLGGGNGCSDTFRGRFRYLYLGVRHRDGGASRGSPQLRRLGDHRGALSERSRQGDPYLRMR